ARRCDGAVSAPLPALPPPLVGDVGYPAPAARRARARTAPRVTAVRHATLLGRIAATPFYQRRVADGRLATWDRLPLTRREELLRDQLEHLPLGTRRFTDAAPPVRVGVTGSGDDLLVLAWSPAALARERAAGARLLRRLGVVAGTRVANSLPGALATPGALLLGDVVEEIGALDVPLGPPD